MHTDPTTRRDFLKLIGLGAAAMVRPARAAAARPPADKPDILLVIADDLAWCDLGCYGNRDVKTPHIDRLAEQGMRFTCAFTATAMCAPTRQQLYTGLFPVRNGAYPNHSRVYDGTKSLVHHLKALGYRVGLIGKRHFGPPASFPFEALGGTRGGLRRKVAQFIRKDRAQPYCLVVASHSPHVPWTQGDASAYEVAKLKMPVYLVDNAETRKALAKYYAEVTDLDREVGECMKAVADDGRGKNTLFLFTSEQGCQFPGGKWTCYDLGLRVAFVVRWPARVKAGSVCDAMIQYVDVTPTLVEAAGGQPDRIDTGRRGAADGGSGFDGKSFLPVLLGKTDKHHDVVFGCHTTRGIIAGSDCYPIRSIRTRTHKYIRNLNHETAFRNTVIVSDRAGYWRSWVRDAKTDARAARLVRAYQHRPAEELYDVSCDPFEQVNLAGEAKYRPLMDRLRKRLEAWMAQQGDKGNETEREARRRQGRGEKRNEKKKEKKKTVRGSRGG